MVSRVRAFLGVLRLWYGKDDERLKYSELLTRKNLDKELSGMSKRQFIRYLNELTKMGFLEKKPDLNRNMWYSKTEEAKRKSLAIFLSDFAELADFHENRDPFGASIVFSQPALTDFMTEKEIEELYTILDKSNALIVDKMAEILIKKRIAEFPASERENAVLSSKTLKIFDEMTRRLEKSGIVKTHEEDLKVSADLLRHAERSGYDTVKKFKNKVGWRFDRMFRYSPLTFEEQEEYQSLKKKLRSYEKFFARIENEMPRVFCCLYNFEMEEFLLSKLDLVLCLDDVIRPIDEVLEILDKVQLTQYKVNIEKTLRSRTLHLPQWTGNDDTFQPKIKWSWDNSTTRKYLRRILISVEKKL